MFCFAKEPQSVIDVLLDGLRLYRCTLFKILPLSILVMSVGAFSSLLQVLNIIPTLYMHHLEHLEQSMGTFRLLGIVVFFVATGLFTVFLFAMLIHGLQTLALGGPLVWRTSVRMIKERGGAIFLSFFLSTLCIVFGFMLFFFPGVFLSVILIFCMPLVILDHVGGIAAIGKSWKLVWGHWWSTFFVFLVPTLLSIFLMSLTLAISKQNEFLLILINFLVMSFFTPFFYSLLLVQFNNLKLEAAAESVDST